MFNRKRVEELEYELDLVKVDNNRLKTALTTAESHISQLLTLRDNIPEDCTPGSYCAACEFSRCYNVGIWDDQYHDYWKSGYICNKANSCKNFIQREVKHD